MKKFLITGACGQIGTELIYKLIELYGNQNVITTDIENKFNDNSNIQFEVLDVLNFEKFNELAQKHQITNIIHLASMLSANGENNPHKLWELNMGGLYNALEVARINKTAFFTPSSIASFGVSTPPNNTPQETIQKPSTIYGISKVAGELLCDYYFTKFNVDTRGLRFPGLISYTAEPGGGTTDYAVEIFYKAVLGEEFTCPLKEDTYLDMMYMEDAINSIIQLIEADSSKLKHRNAFNVSAISICPKDLAVEIKKVLPNFKITYNINQTLQNIAESWPDKMDCSCAIKEWGFNPKYNLEKLTNKMILCLKEKLVN